MLLRQERHGRRLGDEDEQNAARYHDTAMNQTTNVTLLLQISEPEIFYGIEESAQAGEIGAVFPGGTLHGLDYDDLRALGSGTHNIPMNVAAPSESVSDGHLLSRDDELFHGMKFALFGYEVGSHSFETVHWAIVLAFTEANRERIPPLLPERHLDRLRKFAGEVAAASGEDGNQAGGFRVFTAGMIDRDASAAESGLQIPEENLRIIGELFV